MINNWKQKLRDYANEYLKTHPCIDCGEADILVLDFDHRNPDEKERSISDIIGKGFSLERLVKEIAKCDIRCANCHRKRHVREDKNAAFISAPKKIEMSAEAKEKIRQSKLGKPRPAELKDRLSEALMGNHCRKIKDLTGQVFGKLTVLRMGQKKQMFDPNRRNGNGGHRVYWWCQCSCGSPEIEIAGIRLTTGKTKSCGCLRRKFYGNQFKKADSDCPSPTSSTLNSHPSAQVLGM